MYILTQALVSSFYRNAKISSIAELSCFVLPHHQQNGSTYSYELYSAPKNITCVFPEETKIFTTYSFIFWLSYATVLGRLISRIPADDPSPLSHAAIILGEMGAVEDGGLVAQALYIVHCKGGWDRAKFGLDGMLPRSISQHSEDRFVMTMIL